MKRTVAAFAVGFLLIAPTMRAQGGFGVKAGYSYRDVSSRGVWPGGLGSHTGRTIGLALGGSGGLIGFGAEALYAERGLATAGKDDPRRLNYLDIPLYLRASIPLLGLSPYGYAGPQMSFELRCKTETGACPDEPRPKHTYAGVIGAGLRLGGTLSLEGRYIYGLTDFKFSTVTSSESYKTRSFVLLLGLGF